MSALKFLFFLLSTVALDAKPIVVSANTILSDFVRVVGGDYVEGVCLLTPGMDPHSFEPRPADIRKVARAQLVVVNGLGLEGWLTKLVQNSGFVGPVITASDGVDIIHWGQSENSVAGNLATAEADPHAWHDPKQVRHYVENIRDALARLDPDHAAAFAQNTAGYLVQLNAANLVERPGPLSPRRL